MNRHSRNRRLGESRVWSSRGLGTCESEYRNRRGKERLGSIELLFKTHRGRASKETERGGHSQAVDPYDCDESSHRVNSDLATSLCSTFLGFWKRKKPWRWLRIPRSGGHCVPMSAHLGPVLGERQGLESYGLGELQPLPGFVNWWRGQRVTDDP